jgi:hypothetical protein
LQDFPQPLDVYPGEEIGGRNKDATIVNTISRVATPATTWGVVLVLRWGQTLNSWAGGYFPFPRVTVSMPAPVKWRSSLWVALLSLPP